MTSQAGRPQLPPAYRLVSLDRVDSTNDEAHRLAEAGAADGTLVWAQEQMSGRGRRGRAWHSPRGNLYCSLVLRPDAGPAQAAQLSFVACLGVGEAVGSLLPPPALLRYKWPNDVLLDDRKISGILLEAKSAPGAARVDYVVLGVGVNVTSHPEDAETPATDLAARGATAAVAQVLSAFAGHFAAWAARWTREGFAPVRQAWLARARGVGEPIRVRLEGSTLEGRFATLDDSGALVLDLAGGGRRRIAAGDVFFAS
ncbi:MAG: biotin--[acetyl-CoA-carboxylase] ligase [Alphaproteobacteria bacterium]|nr:biotin--[acetyl-CoA-carboxylase] ligase [Alphaproteobacteria bacterium]